MALDPWPPAGQPSTEGATQGLRSVRVPSRVYVL